jgi:hypothetical protein
MDLVLNSDVFFMGQGSKPDGTWAQIALHCSVEDTGISD